MSYSISENRAIGEKCFIMDVDGLRVVFAPKKFSTACAVLCVNFGSYDLRCVGGGKEISLIPGIAHFLEHKMFENEDGSDAFTLLSQSGGDVNACTNDSNTLYVLFASENFEENLRLLLNKVSTPHFTDESVEKEKAIIKQELRMYKDDPYWENNFSLLKSLYHSECVRHDPVGTEESVSRITKEDLYEAYDLFYTARNMALCICGDFEPCEVEDMVRRCIKPRNVEAARIICPEEPSGIFSARSVSYMDVAAPLFAAGIKFGPQAGASVAEAAAAQTIILQLVFGRSGAFYNECYEDGLLGEGFSTGYNYFRGGSYITLCGSSSEPERVLERIASEIESRKTGFCTESEFERAKKVCYSSAISSFGSVSGTAYSLANFIFEEQGAFEYIERLRGAKLEDIERRFKEDYDLSRMAFSVVYDREEKK